MSVNEMTDHNSGCDHHMKCPSNRTSANGPIESFDPSNNVFTPLRSFQLSTNNWFSIPSPWS